MYIQSHLPPEAPPFPIRLISLLSFIRHYAVRIHRKYRYLPKRCPHCSVSVTLPLSSTNSSCVISELKTLLAFLISDYLCMFRVFNLSNFYFFPFVLLKISPHNNPILLFPICVYIHTCLKRPWPVPPIHTHKHTHTYHTTHTWNPITHPSMCLTALRLGSLVSGILSSKSRSSQMSDSRQTPTSSVQSKSHHLGGGGIALLWSPPPPTQSSMEKSDLCILYTWCSNNFLDIQ